jgi:phenylacetate-CoA ligase
MDLSRRRNAREIRARQEAGLIALVEHAVMTVPFWRERFAAAGLGAGDIRSLEDLTRIPVVRRTELQAADPGSLVSSAFPHFDPGFVATRDALFLRALGAAGYRPGQRLMLVTSSERRSAPLRAWFYASLADDPEVLLQDLNRFRPAVLYGCVTPLRRLARLIRASGRPAHRPRAIVTTAEALGPSARRVLRDAFSSEPFDLYSLTETGTIGWECDQHRGYHVSEETAIVELLPTETEGEERRVIVTNLALRGMPLLRFESGDLGVAGSGEPCACGCGPIRIRRVEGRAVDRVRLPDGRMVSPYRFTLGLERIDGIERYQVVQEAIDDFRIRIETRAFDEALETRIRHAVSDLVGANARITIRPEETLRVAPGTRFRVVESRAGGAPGQVAASPDQR